MATVDKTFVFTSDAEGLTDQALSGVVFGWLSSDGTPASGSVRFTQGTKGVTHTEAAVQTGKTWEDWGVPAGATVTHMQLLFFNEKLAANAKLSSHTLTINVRDGNVGGYVGSGALYSASPGTTVDSSWVNVGAGAQQTIDADQRASNAPANLYIEYTVTTLGGGGAANVEQRIDNIGIRLTYQEAGVQGAAAQTLPVLAQAIAGALALDGPIAQILPALSQSASGAVATESVSGAAAQTLPALTQIAAGDLQVAGAVTAQLSVLTQVAAAIATAHGDATQTLSALTQSATGLIVVPITGNVDQTLPTLSQSGEVSVYLSGIATQTLLSFMQSAAGVLGVSGGCTQTLPGLSQAATGALAISSAVAQTLPTLTQSVAGTSDTPIPVRLAHHINLGMQFGIS